EDGIRDDLVTGVQTCALPICAGALGLSATALSAFLEACGSNSTGGGGSTPTANLAGPIDMQTLMTNAKREGKLEAIGFPRTWAEIGRASCRERGELVWVTGCR